MKIIILFLISTLIMGTQAEKADSFYDFKLQSLTNSEKLDFADYEGKVILAVNTASKCGYTSQYEGLQNLYETYRDQGLVIIGFPSGDFGGQEYGTNEEIAEFCEVNFGVEFPLSTKISVTGNDKHPVFNYLTQADNPDFAGEISWNFEKFLINRDGQLIRRFKTQTSPKDNEIVDAIESLLIS